MKVKGKYNVLLLHDDGATKSFRLSRRCVAFVLCIVVLLPIVGGMGVWIGWRAWQDRQVWEQEERVLQQEMANLRVQLDRLSHIDRLIQLHEAGQLPEAGARPSHMSGGAGAAPPETPSDAGAGSGTVQGAGSAPGVAPPVLSSPPAVNGGASGQDTGMTPTTPATPQGVPPPAEPGELESDKLTVDAGQVRVDNVSARLSKDRKLRIRMDLYNETNRQIAGTLSFFLLTADEQRTPIPHNDAAFKISRLKKFASTSAVPDTVSDLTNAALLIEVQNSDKALLLRQIHPIAE